MSIPAQAVKPLQISGFVAELTTPMKAAGKLIDHTSLKHQIDFVAEHGASGVLIGGPISDFSLLSLQELRDIFQTVAFQAKQLSRLYQVGGFTTHESVWLAREIPADDLSALCIIPPYDLNLYCNEIVDHFLAISKASTLPIYIYSPDGHKESQLLLLDQILKKVSTVVGLIAPISSAGMLELYQEYGARARGPLGFEVMSSSAESYTHHVLDAKLGIVSTIAGAFPELMASLVNLTSPYDSDEAKEILAAVGVLHSLLDLKPKEMLACLQYRKVISQRAVRAPRKAMTSKYFKEFIEMLQRLKLLE